MAAQGGRAAALPVARRRARQDPVLCQHAAAGRRRGLYRLRRRACSEEGFKAIKFHCWCEPGARPADVRGGARSVSPTAGSRSCSMSSSATTGRRASGSARRLGELGFGWFEAPLLDTDIEGYRAAAPEQHGADHRRRQHLARPADDRQAIELGCWSALRVDATICGGITPIRKIMALAEAHGMNCRAAVLGLHADPGGQPARHARPTATAPTSSSRRPIRPSSMARST